MAMSVCIHYLSRVSLTNTLHSKMAKRAGSMAELGHVRSLERATDVQYCCCHGEVLEHFCIKIES